MRRLARRLCSHAVAAAAAATLLACATAKAPARRVDDSELTTALRARLAKETRLATFTKVAVDPATGIVTLSGRVASKEDREIAGRLACSVKGVSVVYNELQVQGAIR